VEFSKTLCFSREDGVTGNSAIENSGVSIIGAKAMRASGVAVGSG